MSTAEHPRLTRGGKPTTGVARAASGLVFETEKLRCILEVQDDLLIQMSSVRPRFDEQRCRELPPWRAVMFARVAHKAGLLSRAALDAMVREAQLVGGAGKLKVKRS